MTDEKRFFRQAIKSKRDGGVVSVLALAFDRPGGASVGTMSISWGHRTSQLFAEISRQAAMSSRPEGRSLPIASLRAALQTALPEAISIDHDLGAPWRRADDPKPFLNLPEGIRDAAARFATAFGAWSAMELRGWAEHLEISTDLIDGLTTAMAADDGLIRSQMRVDLAAALAEGGAFDRIKHPILQILARRLEGRELFEGLGPVRRLIRSGSVGNAIDFETWPISADGARYSMVARICVESQPWGDWPIVTVEASRRAWTTEAPARGRLFGQRKITGHLMSDGGAPIAVEFDVPLLRGTLGEPFQPAFMIRALGVGADVAASIPEMVAAGTAGGIFIGIPHSQRYGTHPVGTGASTRDHLDLFDVVAELLQEDGFTPLLARPLGKGPARSVEYHKAVTVQMMIGGVARWLGHNDLTETAIADAAGLLSESHAGSSPEAVREARDILDRISDENRARVYRAFGKDRPKVVLLAVTERERRAMAGCAQALFGTSVDIVDRPLPPNVHGPREILPSPGEKAAERFEARVEAWRPLARTLAEEHSGCHVIVQADEWYENKKKDDRVNKTAGRCALATEADANVQYLLPPDGGARGFSNYLHRMQSALYDLLFGHSGLVSDIYDVVGTAFPDPTTRPKSVLGLSVVAQSKLRGGGSGGKICLATRIDVTEGKTYGRIGWHDGARMRWSSSWKSFFEILKDIAALGTSGLSTAEGRARLNEERANFQSWVRAMIDEAAAAGDRPLVLLDATGASGLWPWLGDGSITGPVTFGTERIDPSACWPGVRLVRILEGRAPRVILRKTVWYEELDMEGRPVGSPIARPSPTVVENTIRVGSGPHYWATAKYFQVSFPRGLSVYRKLIAYPPLGRAGEEGLPPKVGADSLIVRPAEFDLTGTPYRVPNPIEITVAVALPGDDPDAIALLAHSLRFGYGHTPSLTALPAPLSFESKARDYMGRFALDNEEDDEEIRPTSPPETAKRADPPPLHPGALVESAHAEGQAVPSFAHSSPSETRTPQYEAFPSRAVRLSAGSADWYASRLGEGVLARIVQSAPSAPFEPATLVIRSTKTMTATDLVMGTRRTVAGKLPISRPAPNATDRTNEVRTSVPAPGKGQIGDLRAELENHRLPIPAFVTVEWLSNWISFTPQIIRILHERRQKILKVCPWIDWPQDQRPTAEQFLALIHRGLGEPWILSALSKASEGKLELLNRADSTFKAASFAAADALGEPLPGGPGATAADILIRAGDLDTARSMIFLRSALKRASKHFRSVLAGHSVLSDLEPYMAAMERYEAFLDGLESRAEGSVSAVEIEALSTDPASAEPKFVHEADGSEVVNIMAGKLDMAKTPSATAEQRDGAQSESVNTKTLASIDDATTAWTEAVRSLASEADILAGSPDEEGLLRLERLVSEVREAWVRYKALQPQLIDTTSLVDRLIAVATPLATIAEVTDAPEIPPSAHLAQEVIPAVEESTASAEAALADAVAVRTEVDKLAERMFSQRDYSVVAPMAEMTERFKRRAEEGLGAVNAAVVALVEGARVGASSAAPGNVSMSAILDENPADNMAIVIEPTSPVGDAPTAVPSHPVDLDFGPTDAQIGDDSALGDEEGRPEDVEFPYEEHLESVDDPVADLLRIVNKSEEVIGPTDELEPEVDSIDTHAEVIDEALIRLFAGGRFSLAYHLHRAAERIYPKHEFAFGPELVLLAVGGRFPASALQTDPGEFVEKTLQEVLASIQSMSESADGLVPVRALCTFIATLGLALQHPASSAPLVVAAAYDELPETLRGEFYSLKEALLRAAHSRFDLSPALLRAAADVEAVARLSEERRKAAIEKVDQISALTFRFSNGGRIRSDLCAPDGRLGKLRTALSQNGDAALKAADDFVKLYPGWSEVANLVAQVSERIAPRDPIVGAGRDRLVGHIVDLSSICSEFVAAKTAVPEVRVGGRRNALVEIVDALRVGAERAAAGIAALPTEGTSGPVKCAAWFAMGGIRRFIDVLSGKADRPSGIEHLVLLHGPLLGVRGLHWGRSWLPAPYEPDRIVECLSEGPIPSFPSSEPQDTEKAFRDAFAARLADGSFVAASMLLQTGPTFGITEDALDELQAHLDGDTPTRREDLSRKVGLVRRDLDRIQRMGASGKRDEVQSLNAQLERLASAAASKDGFPAQIDLEERTLAEDGERILDFVAAEGVLEEMATKALGIIKDNRAVIQRQIREMAESGALNDEDRASVQALLERDDAISAQERLEFLRIHGHLPQPNVHTTRFGAFYPKIPQFVARLSDAEFKALPQRIGLGANVGPLSFETVPAARLKDMRALYESWRQLRNSFGEQDPNKVGPHLRNVLDRLNIDAKLGDRDSERSHKQRQIFVCEATFAPPTDPDGLLLPDFGSLAQGHYRLAASARMPTEEQINELGSSDRPTILFVTEPVGVERREQLALGSRQGRRKLLVVDDALLLYVIAQADFRVLTMFECAQPFAWSMPYGDYGRNTGVPPEMFFGRRDEFATIVEPFGSCIVYGGRRLGKTALLKHIETVKNSPKDGVVVAHVDLWGIGTGVLPDKIWSMASEQLARASSGGVAVFKASVANWTDFERGVRLYLDNDPTRRILLLLDEADGFIKADAKSQSGEEFKEFRNLQKLMDEYRRRFKFVLAGLANVTRIVQSDNSPLKQNASNPQRIGPLMGAELADAELLIVKPLAAMGYIFEHREDVWRILSHTNYYPVLAQTFCASLLETLVSETVTSRKVVRTISGRHVEIALDRIKKDIKEKFEFTIKELDDRYEVLTYVVAEKSLRDEAEGRIDEGMTIEEIRARAQACWPKAFERLRVAAVGDLLDEMIGLGVLRQVPGDRFTLRSPSILHILGTRDSVASLMDDFLDRPVKEEFEPNSVRRYTTKVSLGAAAFELEPGQPSPLTFGQEFELLSDRALGAVPISLVFGSPLSDIGAVAAALYDAALDIAGGDRSAVDCKLPRNREELASILDGVKASKGPRPLVIVDMRQDWTPDWVIVAARSRAIRTEAVRLVFVGGPEHAFRWVVDPRCREPMKSVREISIETWTASAIDHVLMKEGIAPATVRPRLLREIGGFNKPVREVVKDFTSKTTADRAILRIEKGAADLLKDKELPLQLAGRSIMRHVILVLVANYSDPQDRITPYYIQEGVFDDLRKTGAVTNLSEDGLPDPLSVVRFGTLMGLLEPCPSLEGSDPIEREYVVNPLLLALAKKAA